MTPTDKKNGSGDPGEKATRAWLEQLHPNRLEQAEVADAAARLERFLAVCGPDAGAYRKLALLQGRLGRMREAGELFKMARRIDLKPT